MDAIMSRMDAIAAPKIKIQINHWLVFAAVRGPFEMEVSISGNIIVATEPAISKLDIGVTVEISIKGSTEASNNEASK